MFDRAHLADVFAESYKALPVRTRTLENMGNFKGLVAKAVRRIPGISGFQAFRVRKEGSYMTVEVKRKMYHDVWLGFTSYGREVGSGEGYSPFRILTSGAVRFENTPDYPLKVVDPDIIRQIGIRQQASWPRVAASYPGGECGT